MPTSGGMHPYVSPKPDVRVGLLPIHDSCIEDAIRNIGIQSMLVHSWVWHWEVPDEKRRQEMHWGHLVKNSQRAGPNNPT